MNDQNSCCSKYIMSTIEQIPDNKQRQKYHEELIYLSNMYGSNDDAYHNLYMDVRNHMGHLFKNYGIFEVNTLSDVQKHLESLNYGKTIVFLDWDDTIVHSGTTEIIEPNETSNMFGYMLDNNIDFIIITGRFWQSVLFDNYLNRENMKYSIDNTIQQPLKNLGFVIDNSSQSQSHEYIHHNGERVGIHYMNILFGSEKGRIIQGYLEQLGKYYTNIIFVDDYDPYLENVSVHVPHSTIIRRKKVLI